MVEVRELRRSDRPRLASLLRMPGFDLPDLAFRVEQGYDHGSWSVSVEGGDVVGFLRGHHGALLDDRVGYGDVPTSWITWIGVHPDARLSGVAKLLLHDFAISAMEAGDVHIACLVDQRTPTRDRLAFFSRVGLYPVFPDDPDDLVAGQTATVLQLTAKS